MKTYGGTEMQPQAFLTLAPNGDKRSAPRPARFFSGVRALDTLRIGGRTSLEAVEKWKISCPCRESNYFLTFFRAVQHYKKVGNRIWLKSVTMALIRYITASVRSATLATPRSVTVLQQCNVLSCYRVSSELNKVGLLARHSQGLYPRHSHYSHR
jgi:hypothetical protein